MLNKSRSTTLAIVAAAVMSAIAVAYYAMRQQGFIGAQEASPAKARALGARWRASKTDALARQYADALVSAGLYDQLLEEIGGNGLFAADEQAATLFSAEALLRQRRYEDARDKAAQETANPWLAYVQARANYAMSADEPGAIHDLGAALRGPEDLLIDAWLFRARVALDANDSATASAAMRRAKEAGAPPSRTDTVEIEAAVRAGDLPSAAKRLSERASRAKKRAVPAADYRIGAMIRLRQEDGQGAVRLLDRANAVGEPAPLLTALAKWRAGDVAQAYALVEKELSATPDNWVTLDLAAAIARDLGKTEEADRLLMRLSEVRPALGVLRRLRKGLSLDTAVSELSALTDGEGVSGAGAALLGEGAALPDALREADERERNLVTLGAALASNNPRALKPYEATVSAGTDPVTLMLGGAAYERLGEWARADEMYVRASVAAQGQFTPVRRAADLALARGATERAIRLIEMFASAHPDHVAARLALARAHLAGDDARGAARIYAGLAPEDVFASREAALSYAQAAKGAGEKAREEMLAAARQGSSDMAILGEASLAVGDDAGGSAALREALIADPADERIAALYAGAMTRLGKEEEAQSLLAAIAKRAGKNETVEESSAPEPEKPTDLVKNQP
ncbi:MAG: hypothetical protein KDE05_00945 [Parvularculaceae bacterium]|nr:hypothetical protein [Parvularculaceae bacterium]